MTAIGVGLAGFGLAGRSFHAPVIRAVPGLRLAAILQRKGNEAAEAYPDARIVRSLEEMLAMPEIRLVVIASTNDTHHAFARQALEAGRDVVVDKPFTNTFEEAADLANLARKTGRLLTVYQNRRYDADFQTLRELVAANSFGRIVRFEANYDRFRPQLRPGAWRERSGPGTGILFDLGPHLIDHALVLFGRPEAVTADVRIERDAAVTDDAFDVVLHYPGGLRAVLRSTMLAASLRPRFLLHGTKGAFVKLSFDPQETNLRFGKIPAEGAWGAEPEEQWPVLTLFDGANMTESRVRPAAVDYRDYYANVRDVLLGRAAPAVSVEQALDLMRTLELARESSAQRRTMAWPAAASA